LSKVRGVGGSRKVACKGEESKEEPEASVAEEEEEGAELDVR
jgi:hypothetical protein